MNSGDSTPRPTTTVRTCRCRGILARYAAWIAGMAGVDIGEPTTAAGWLGGTLAPCAVQDVRSRPRIRGRLHETHRRSRLIRASPERGPHPGRYPGSWRNRSSARRQRRSDPRRTRTWRGPRPHAGRVLLDPPNRKHGDAEAQEQRRRGFGHDRPPRKRELRA